MSMRLLDTHAHVNFAAFQNDSAEVIARAQQNEVGMILVGTNLATSQRAVALAEQYQENVWAAIGLHPIHLAKDITEESTFDGTSYRFTTKAEQFDKRKFFALAKSSRVVAVGEIGLDYFHLDDFRATTMTAEEFQLLQEEVLYEILGFAREIARPNIFHCRDAYDRFLHLINDFGVINGVVHCFTGSKDQARALLDAGLLIGFTGIVTFPNARALQEVARFVPLDRMLLETDCPYLAPQAVRGQRNEPSYVRFVAEKIAQLHGKTPEQVGQQTMQNARMLFSLSPK